MEVKNKINKSKKAQEEIIKNAVPAESLFDDPE